MRNLLRKMRGAQPRPEQHPDFPVIAGLHYRETLTEIERRLEPDWYLEIGSRTGDSLRDRRCNFIAIDPEFDLRSNVFHGAEQMHFMQMTSDAFFDSGFLATLGVKPDLVFIDGMHLFEFALRDFMNAEANMTRDGMICFHDVCPFNYEMTERDPGPVPAWTGDVWKTVAILLEYRPDLSIDILDARKTGLGCVGHLDPGNTALRDAYDDIVARYTDMDLTAIGAAAYYDRFALRDAGAFVASLGAPRPAAQSSS